MRIQKTLMGNGLVLCGLVMLQPRVSPAAQGCNNAFLNGTYNVQVANQSIVNVLASIRAANSGQPLPPPPTGGFGSNANSQGGTIPGLGRFFFDGNGSIIGQAGSVGQPGPDDASSAGNGLPASVTIGSYTVNDDCSSTLQLNAGPSFNAVVAGGGSQILFLGTDGLLGSMTRAANSCVNSVGSQQSFAFSAAGAQRAANGSNGSSVVFTPYSTLGSVILNTDGSFFLTAWTFSAGALQPVAANGTFTIGIDCALTLSLAAGSPPATPNLRGFYVDQQSGVLSVQPDSTNVITSPIVAQ